MTDLLMAEVVYRTIWRCMYSSSSRMACLSCQPISVDKDGPIRGQYYLAIVADDAQGADGVVKSPETIIAVKYLQDASEGEGQAKEHYAVLAASLVRALQQPQTVSHQLCQGVVRKAERRNENISYNRVDIVYQQIFSMVSSSQAR